jgi:hypothetical protein
VKTVSDAISSGNVADQLGPTGAIVAGQKYQFIKGDDSSAYVKLVCRDPSPPPSLASPPRACPAPSQSLLARAHTSR